jgi:hypothetical protein
VTHSLISWAYRQAGVSEPSKVRVLGDLSDWAKGPMIQQDCVWSVSPTVARQAFTTAALAWAESPLDSSHLFIVPRFMQREFGRVNCHIQYLGQFDPKDLPVTAHPCRVPLLLFYLPCHTRSLATPTSRRVVLPTFPRMPT